MRWQWLMLVFVPISILLEVLHMPPAWVFLTACLAIIPLAGEMGRATEELAKYRGQAIGGLMNATFGNATELIIAIVAVFNGEVDIVRASLIGSIVGNLLLVLGLSALLGGMKFKEQQFSKDAAGTYSSMMFIAVILLLVPAIFLLVGALVDVHALIAYAPLGIAAALIFMFAIRPAMVFLMLGIYTLLGNSARGLSRNELLFISFVRETGAIPAVLLVTAVARMPPPVNGLVEIGMWVILITLVLAPPLTPWVARKLGVAE